MILDKEGGDRKRGGRHWFLNHLEIDAMRQLMTAGHPYAALIYQLELRINMDYATYVVGITRRLSERGILELVERDPETGSNWHKKKRDRHWVQRQISVLIKFGLIEKIPKKRMCYRLLLANVDLVRAREAGTKSGAEAGAKLAQGKRAAKQGGLRIVADNTPDKNPMRTRKKGGKTAYADTTSEKIFTTTTGLDVSGDSSDVADCMSTGQMFTMEQLRQVDMQMVADAYHKVLPGLPVVRFFDVPAYRLMVAHIWFWVADGKHQSAEFWRWYFGQCGKSDFLMGRAFDQRRGKFKASFKYLIDRDVFSRVMNGEYS